MNPAPKKYYSVKQAAKLLSVSTNTLYKYLDEGKIRSRRIGKGRFKIPLKELLPYIEGNTPLQIEDNSYRDVSQPPITEQPSQTPNTPRNVYVTFTDPKEVEQKEENINVAENKKLSLDMGDIGPGLNDIQIFRMFKSLVFLGLGVIYIMGNPASYALQLSHSGTLNTFLLPFLPYALLTVGVLYAFENSLCKLRVIGRCSLDVFASIVSGYYALVSLISGNYGLFVWTVSICTVIVGHVLAGVKEVEKSDFFGSFAKFSLVLAAVGGIVVTLIPESFPVYTFVDFIKNNREIFAFIWFLFLFTPAAYLVSPKGKDSVIRTPYFAFTSIIALIIAVKSMLIPNWDIAYFSLLGGVFGLFLTWWINSKLVLDTKKVKYLFLTFLWTVFVVLFSFMTLDLNEKQNKKEMTNNIQQSLDKTIHDLNGLFDGREAVLTSYAGQKTLVEAIKSENTEKLVEVAKNIYDQVGNMARVMIYNNKGIAIGVYPRNSLIQGTNFSSRDYFQKTLSLKRSYVSGVFMSILDTKTVVQTEPIFENNSVVGIIGIGTSPENFIKALDIGRNEFDIHITDAEGNLLVDTHGEMHKPTGNVYALVDKKSDTVTLTTQVPYTNWEVNVRNVTSYTPQRLSTLATSLISIMMMNTLFSVYAGVLISRKKEEVNLLTNLSGNDHGLIATT